MHRELRPGSGWRRAARALPGVAVALLTAVLMAVPWAGSAQAQGRRVALVIGNGSYRSVDRLTNPANDARLMAETLKQSGFTLIGDGPQLNLDKGRFDRTVQEFGRALQGAEVGLFYYSGHGMQVGGVNWLVPVDASPTNARDLDFQMVDASLVLRQMEGSGTRLNMVILDACRNNPFAVRGTRGSTTGLAEMHAPEGTLISYATQPGNVAADGQGANSPYTVALASAMRRPGVDVFQVFNQVGLIVKRETFGQQQPWLASSPISGPFYFFNGPVTIQPPPAPMDAEAVYWQSIANSRTAADFQSYLQRYPRGTFAELAQRRLAGLSAPSGGAEHPAGSSTPRGEKVCVVPGFRGMTEPGGTGLSIRVGNDGRSCRWNIYASVKDRRPWDVVRVTVAPQHGTATTLTDQIAYVPARGYGGSDSFTVQANGTTDAGRPLSGLLRVEVTVVPP